MTTHTQTGTVTDIAELRRLSARTRQLILETVHHAGAGHVGGPLSVADILVNLYFNRLRIDPENPGDPARDRCILSKGHSSIALYTVLALRGYLPVEELATFDAIDSRLQGHPDLRALPGLDMSTGSLGQGLSPGIGMALGARLAKLDFHTWVILGDGEIQEGQIWEAAFVASRYRLHNLIDDPGGKFAAFGWNVIEIDGHDHDALGGAFDAAVAHRDGPTVIVAHTIKGKGISFMEHEYNWHATPPDEQQLADAVAELQGALA
jgi:transketolase